MALTVDAKHRTQLPVRCDVSPVLTLTGMIALLLAVSSFGGLIYGPRGWYDPDSVTLPALLGQDAVTIVFGLPLLLTSAWAARRGSTRALLCWMGALFYVAYFYYFYVIGIRVNAFFPGYIALVSMSMYGVLFLVFSVNPNGVKACFSSRTPVRIIGGFLAGTSLAFTTLWLSLIISHLAAGTTLDEVSRFVIAIDGVVLLPLMFWSGTWLWRREPMGYVLGGILLVKLTATFLTLIATTLVSQQWGQAIPPLQTTMYFMGLIGSLALLARYLRCIESPRL